MDKHVAIHDGRFMRGNDTITDAEFANLRAELAPDDADAWQQVPWQTSLAQAVRVAAREKRLLVMVVRSGQPLGCTCNNGLVDRAATPQSRIGALSRPRLDGRDRSTYPSSLMVSKGGSAES